MLYEIKNRGQDPFDLTFHIYELLLHNCMIDSGAAMTVIAKSIMEAMGFQITRPYNNVRGMDSTHVHAFELIKNIKEYLFSCSNIYTLMDVVVVDLPPVYGMLLSRRWSAGLGGQLQMELSYTTIPNSDGKMVRIYQEPFYDGHLERYEDDIKNSNCHGDLFPNDVFTVMEGDNNSPRSEDDTNSIWSSFHELDSSE